MNQTAHSLSIKFIIQGLIKSLIGINPYTQNKNMGTTSDVSTFQQNILDSSNSVDK